jgi:hypothetical protein
MPTMSYRENGSGGGLWSLRFCITRNNRSLVDVAKQISGAILDRSGGGEVPYEQSALLVAWIIHEYATPSTCSVNTVSDNPLHVYSVIDHPK